MANTVCDLHVIRVTDTSIQTATADSTDWYLWLPRNQTVTWFDEPIPGTMARVRAPDWLMERHRRILLGTWSTSE
jgi:hypothetical protein